MLDTTLGTALQVALRLAREAADVVARVYREDFAVDLKGDGSPITEADRQANELIVAGLRAAFPDDAVLSEEAPFVSGGRRMWLVDPLDGTSDFTNRTGDFAVMIGLCVDARPVLGVVAAPALGRLWAGGEGLAPFEESGGERRPVRLVEPTEGAPLRVLQSRMHPPPQVELILRRLPGAVPARRGGVGVKIGLLAAGEADVYLHPAPGTHLWDCCAPEAILNAAGGKLTTAAGAPVVYDPTRTANPAGILAAHPAVHARVLSVLQAETGAPGTSGVAPAG